MLTNTSSANTIKNKKYELFNIFQLAEINHNAYLFLKKTNVPEPLSSKIETDDGLKSKLWTEAYKAAGYYYDNPSQDARNKMFINFRYNFCSLFEDNDIPNVNSRKDLLTWVCQKHNNYLKQVNSEYIVDCNYDRLSKLYGYNEKNILNTYGNKINLRF